jgi:hypothetical protein
MRGYAVLRTLEWVIGVTGRQKFVVLDGQALRVVVEISSGRGSCLAGAWTFVTVQFDGSGKWRSKADGGLLAPGGNGMNLGPTPGKGYVVLRGTREFGFGGALGPTPKKCCPFTF